MRRLCDLARAGKAGAANELDAQLQPTFEFLGVEPNPIPVKWAMAQMGLIESGLRLPLTPLSDRYGQIVRDAIFHAIKNGRKGELVVTLADRVPDDISYVQEIRDELLEKQKEASAG